MYALLSPKLYTVSRYFIYMRATQKAICNALPQKPRRARKAATVMWSNVLYDYPLLFHCEDGWPPLRIRGRAVAGTLDGVFIQISCLFHRSTWLTEPHPRTPTAV